MQKTRKLTAIFTAVLIVACLAPTALAGTNVWAIQPDQGNIYIYSPWQPSAVVVGAEPRSHGPYWVAPDFGCGMYGAPCYTPCAPCYMPCAPCAPQRCAQGCQQRPTKQWQEVIGKQDGNTLYSRTGVQMNTKAVWTVTEKNGKKIVHVDVYLDHYTLFTCKNEVGLKIKLGDDEAVLESAPIKFGDNAFKETLINSCEFEITDKDLEKLPIEVTWQYYGTYSNIRIDEVFSRGVVDLTDITSEKDKAEKAASEEDVTKPVETTVDKGE